MRQPSLFNFKSEVVRSSGFTPAEERELLVFCLADDYPREITVERTGTRYKLNSAMGAALLYRAIRKQGATAIFGREVYAQAAKRGRKFTY